MQELWGRARSPKKETLRRLFPCVRRRGLVSFTISSRFRTSLRRYNVSFSSCDFGFSRFCVDRVIDV